MRASRAAGGAALVVAGAQVALALTSALFGLMLADPTEPMPPSALVILSRAAVAVHAIALAVLAVVVVRGRLLEPVARVSLLVLASATAVSWLSQTGIAAFLTGDGWLPLLLLLLFALRTAILVASIGLVVGLLVHGRSVNDGGPGRRVDPALRAHRQLAAAAALRASPCSRTTRSATREIADATLR
jgi:hypothetical protein